MRCGLVSVATWRRVGESGGVLPRQHANEAAAWATMSSTKKRRFLGSSQGRRGEVGEGIEIFLSIM